MFALYVKTILLDAHQLHVWFIKTLIQLVNKLHPLDFMPRYFTPY